MRLAPVIPPAPATFSIDLLAENFRGARGERAAASTAPPAAKAPPW
jgi:hypothetical protein